MVGAFGFATFIPPYQGKDVVREPHRPSLMTFSSDVRLARGRGDEATRQECSGVRVGLITEGKSAEAAECPGGKDPSKRE